MSICVDNWDRKGDLAEQVNVRSVEDYVFCPWELDHVAYCGRVSAGRVMGGAKRRRFVCRLRSLDSPISSARRSVRSPSRV